MLEVIRLGFSRPVPRDRHADYGLPPGPVEYRAAWELQRRIHAEVVAGTRPNTLILLEHQPVFTAGKRTEPHERPTDATPVVDVDRGGKITWHGPHQLVGYPIVRLPAPVDGVGFVRGLEQALIRVCAHFGVEAEAIEGRSGVWYRTPDEIDRKVAAIGMRVARQVMMHGFALNCANELDWVKQIIPCGIEDAGVTTLSNLTGRYLDVPDVIDVCEREVSELIRERCVPTSLPAGAP